MTQSRTPKKTAAPPIDQPPVSVHLTPGMAVRLKDGTEDQTGTVVESDEWWDTLLLRGVDISDQTLVEWTIVGLPFRRWERTGQLEIVQPEPEAAK
jgi:hypothetical protein